MLLVAGVYWALTIVLSLFQDRLEKRMAESDRRIWGGHDVRLEPRPAGARRQRCLAAPGALTPPNVGPVVRLLEIEKYFGTNYVPRGRALEVYPGETSGSGGVS